MAPIEELLAGPDGALAGAAGEFAPSLLAGVAELAGLAVSLLAVSAGCVQAVVRTIASAKRLAVRMPKNLLIYSSPQFELDALIAEAHHS
jgi:hypothetical protein